MRDIPLLMKGPLVLKAMAGEKTQTRRLKFRGEVGDRIWIKETFARRLADGEVIYRASESRALCDLKWKPSIFMPRIVCRLWLEVIAVHTDALQDITEAAAIAEGMSLSAGGMWCGRPHDAHGFPRQHNTAREAFADIWDDINAPHAPWKANPAVKVVTFRRIETPEVTRG